MTVPVDSVSVHFPALGSMTTNCSNSAIEFASAHYLDMLLPMQLAELVDVEHSVQTHLNRQRSPVVFVGRS